MISRAQFLRCSGIAAALALSVAAGVLCCRGATRREGVRRREWRKELNPREKSLLEEAARHPCESPKLFNYKKFQGGDPGAAAALAWNNDLWITLYETAKRKTGSFGVRLTENTDEGDPVTVYYLVKDGVVRRITDWSRDRFAGAGVTDETLAPFLIGYTGHDLPCPCGSGKKWLDCDVGHCKLNRRRPTFVITTRHFPQDKELHWIPPPSPHETSMTWQYAP